MNDTFALNTLETMLPGFSRKLKERYNLWMLKNLKI